MALIAVAWGRRAAPKPLAPSETIHENTAAAAAS
jgi:hypothetical protein